MNSLFSPQKIGVFNDNNLTSPKSYKNSDKKLSLDFDVKDLKCNLNKNCKRSFAEHSKPKTNVLPSNDYIFTELYLSKEITTPENMELEDNNYIQDGITPEKNENE